jgi:hypothetical protein
MKRCYICGQSVYLGATIGYDKRAAGKCRMGELGFPGLAGCCFQPDEVPLSHRVTPGALPHQGSPQTRACTF